MLQTGLVSHGSHRRSHGDSESLLCDSIREFTAFGVKEAIEGVMVTPEKPSLTPQACKKQKVRERAAVVMVTPKAPSLTH